MLKRDGVDHTLRAASAITGARRFVLLRTGAAAASQPRLPLAMTLSSEPDLYAEDTADAALLAELDDPRTRAHGVLAVRLAEVALAG